VKAARRVSETDDVVRLDLPCGVLLILSTDQYRQGLRRGKAERRAQRLAARMAKRQATGESATLAWVDNT
jgi:hypothetical protein